MDSASRSAPARIRCAIYTRKSTEEGLDQDFNSLQAQRESAEAYIQSQKHLGWVLSQIKYDDGGFSGGSLDRPALAQLLADIDARRVDCVVVYKVDRLSRSLLDFSRLMERFDERSVSFVSVTQQFNTTSSLGRLTLNILLSFAQFEREIIAERTRDKMSAARRKGKWVGGTPMLGYDVPPEGRRLVVNEKEARLVREVYELYRAHRSLAAVVEELATRRWTTKTWTSRSGIKHVGQHFDERSLRHLLTHAVYAGKVEYKGAMYDGDQPAIVEGAVWEEVNRELRGTHLRGPTRAKHHAMLRGLLFCATCDQPMIATYAQKRGLRYRYYVCRKARKEGWSECSTKTASAQVIEDSVVEQLQTLLANDDARHELEISPDAWQKFPGETDYVVRRVVERVSYNGTTGVVLIDVKRPDSSQEEHRRIEYKISRRRGPSPTSFALQPPPETPPAKPPRLARLVALAHRLEELIRSGAVKDFGELALIGQVSPARLSQILILAQLAPDIQERILFLAPWEERAISERELREVARDVRWDRQRISFQERVRPNR